MKNYIFGTGKYYSMFRDYINLDEVISLIDNNEEKWGSIVDGKQVISAQSADYYLCDYIIIMVRNYSVIEEQLLAYGVSRDKIKNYTDIVGLLDIKANVITDSGAIGIEEWKKGHPGKSVLVCSHDFTRTGVPVAMMNACKLLKKMHYQVLYLAIGNGSLEEDIRDCGIDYINNAELFFQSKKFYEVITSFDIFLVGSICSNKFIDWIASSGKPIVWWLHESYDELYRTYRIKLYDNIHFYAVGKRVKRIFNQEYPSVNIQEMMYFLPEKENSSKLIEPSNHSRMRFAIIGTFENRKGQDIFIEAIKLINEKHRKEMMFIFAGKAVENEWSRNILKEIDGMENAVWLNELSQKEVEKLYEEIDVLVCPSRDDPLPIVVTQAMQNGIPCIVSSEVGQSELMVNGTGGSVFESEDVEMLKDLMEQYVEEREMLVKKGDEARKIFDAYFSEKIMKMNLQRIFELYV